MEKKSIGELIEYEVRKQQIPIVEFARKICCKRNNVYDIFKRSKIDIVQLKLISIVLHRNFFKEIADDIDLVNVDDVSEKELLQQKAVSQFFDVVPDILKEMGLNQNIVFCKLDENKYQDCATPDFGLIENFVTFTIGDTLKERIGENPYLPIKIFEGENGAWVEICLNRIYNTICVNIKLDYKSAEEWRKFIKLALDTYLNCVRK